MWEVWEVDEVTGAGRGVYTEGSGGSWERGWGGGPGRVVEKIISVNIYPTANLLIYSPRGVSLLKIIINLLVTKHDHAAHNQC